MSERENSSSKNIIFHIIVSVLLLINLIVASSIIFTPLKIDATNKQVSDTLKPKITKQPDIHLQIDLQNGTGDNGVAAEFRTFLKKNGFDVVEMGNYKISDVLKTVVLDRKGDFKSIKNLGYRLGLDGKYISQQINKDLYLDATIIIGKDYLELNPYIEKKK
jgi:hypothetical protein